MSDQPVQNNAPVVAPVAEAPAQPQAPTDAQKLQAITEWKQAKLAKTAPIQYANVPQTTQPAYSFGFNSTDNINLVKQTTRFNKLLEYIKQNS